MLEERLGAERAVLPGAGHSVQRLGEPFNELLSEFVLRAEHVNRAWPGARHRGHVRERPAGPPGQLPVSRAIA